VTVTPVEAAAATDAAEAIEAAADAIAAAAAAREASAAADAAAADAAAADAAWDEDAAADCAAMWASSDPPQPARNVTDATARAVISGAEAVRDVFTPA
jgi:chemosensory pili system protein ChpA (sensor histidine kinase/response regulator)